VTTDQPDIENDLDLWGNPSGIERHYSGQDHDSYAEGQPRYVAADANRGDCATSPTQR